MSHSKHTKRGYSLFLENWNPAAKRFINTCKICGHQGYSPSIDEEDFGEAVNNYAIARELKRTLQPLPLDEFGRCEQCAKVQDNTEK